MPTPWTWANSNSTTTSVCFAGKQDGTRLIAGASDGIYSSSNGGQTWTKRQSTATTVIAVASPPDGTVMFAVNAGPSGSLYFSGDGGLTWTPATGPVLSGPTWYTGLCCYGSAGSVNVVVTTTNYQGSGPGYTSTTLFDSVLGQQNSWNNSSVIGALTSVTCNAAGSLFFLSDQGSSSDGYIYTSTNGINWYSVSILGQKSWSSVACNGDNTNTYLIACSSEASGAIVVRAKYISGSFDNYVTVTPPGTNSYGNVAIGLTENNLYVVNQNGFQYSSNGGSNWSSDTSKSGLFAIYINQTGSNVSLPLLLGANGIFYATYPPTPICFKEGSKILCLVDGKESYIPVETMRPGTLVKTVRSGYKKVEHIGHSKVYNPAHTLRSKNRLYVCTKTNYPEVTEDLVLTGCHSILVGRLSTKERADVIDITGDTYVTDGHYRLVACADERAVPYTEEGLHTIWHFALEHDDYYMNYGVYANGLLVETTSKRMMKELSGMELV